MLSTSLPPFPSLLGAIPFFASDPMLSHCKFF
jgi:hypothetical protein